MKLNLGNQIRMNRRRMNLTQEQLAEEFGTSPQAISRWETGSTYPDIEMLPMIASFFGISVDAMLGCTEEEKEKFCRELQEAFTAAVTAKDIEKTIELMREIRRNLREYQSYWFWDMYNKIFATRLFHDERVLEEMRLLTEEIFQVCPRDSHFAVIEWMADMEDDEHIDAFLEAYASREDMSRSRLLFNRYKMREELEKIEPIRQYILWYELDGIITSANDWQEYLCQDAAHFKWFSETQLNYLNAICCLSPDKKHFVSGGSSVDLWCQARIDLGLRYTIALAKLGEMDAAYDAFEDTISILEQVMAISEDKFELGCTSPALKGASVKSKFFWMDHDGREYRDLCMNFNNWCNWIIPSNYQDAVKNSWFDPLREDSRFDSLFERLNNCVISREIQK